MNDPKPAKTSVWIKLGAAASVLLLLAVLMKPTGGTTETEDSTSGVDCRGMTAVECYTARDLEERQRAFALELDRSGELDRMADAIDDTRTE